MCDCATQINAELEKHNGRLATGIQVTPNGGIKLRHLMATEKINPGKRKAVPSVMCSYCPFCGEKLAGLEG